MAYMSAWEAVCISRCLTEELDWPIDTVNSFGLLVIKCYLKVISLETKE